MTEIYLHISARVADYVCTHPYAFHVPQQQELQEQVQEEAPKPRWERKQLARPDAMGHSEYFVDHATKTTHWTLPEGVSLPSTTITVRRLTMHPSSQQQMQRAHQNKCTYGLDNMHDRISMRITDSKRTRKVHIISPQ